MSVELLDEDIWSSLVLLGFILFLVEGILLCAGSARMARFAKEASVVAKRLAGGDVGFVVREAMTPEVGAVVFSLPAGQFTPHPVRILAGSNMDRLTDRFGSEWGGDRYFTGDGSYRDDYQYDH